MAIYTIGDLHLSFHENKPMSVFGGNWEGHEEKIRKDWKEKVKERTNQAQLASHRPAGKTRAASGAQANSLSRFTEARRRADKLPPPKQVRRCGG